MNPFLNNYITSLGSRQQAQVASVLSDAILSKTDLSLIVQKLISFSQFVPITLSLETSLGQIQSASFQNNLRDATNAVNDIFLYSNYVSSLLYNLGVLLHTDAKSLEDQISSLEKRLQNYSFLIADNNAYSFGFLEDFANNNNRDTFPWVIPDRASQVFAPNEQAIVDSAMNMLVLAQNLQNTYSIIPSIVSSNATAFVVSDTGIQNSVTSLTSTGWRISFASAQPITSSLPGAGMAGAQMLVEFLLNEPSPASEIEIVPFADTSMQVAQVFLFPTHASAATQLLDAPKTLTGPETFHFPLQSVQKFQLLLNQPTYNRVATYTNVSEASYAQLSTTQPPPRKKNFNHFFRYYFKVTKTFPGGNLSRPASFRLGRGQNIWEVLRNTKTKLGAYQSWVSPAVAEGTITNLFLQNPGYYKKIFRTGIASYDFLATNQEQITPSINDPNPITAMNNPAPSIINTGFSYQYDLGLQFVAVGSNPVGDKGVFISKPMSAGGFIGACKLKVVDDNYRALNSDRNSSLLTSTEYSVSNASNPQNELDWTPIMPVQADPLFVESERFFPNYAGNGQLRFGGDRERPINLYRNGYDVGVNSSNYILDNSLNVVTGISISIGTFTSDDIFTIRYFCAQDHTTVVFGDDLTNPPLASASDGKGSGEGFSQVTGGRNSVTLLQTPYVDHTQVMTSTYDMTHGMFPYQPITVQLANGTVATNLTNYTNGPQASLANYSTGYYYIQSGNVLMFNQAVNQAFRVYYRYLQGSTRVRVILRVNDKNFVSPTVSSYNLKAKLVQPIKSTS